MLKIRISQKVKKKLAYRNAQTLEEYHAAKKTMSQSTVVTLQGVNGLSIVILPLKFKLKDVTDPIIVIP